MTKRQRGFYERGRLRGMFEAFNFVLNVMVKFGMQLHDNPIATRIFMERMSVMTETYREQGK